MKTVQFLKTLEYKENSCIKQPEISFNYNGKANVVGVGFTFRTIDNYIPVLDKFSEYGDSINLALFPNKQDPNHHKIYTINSKHHVFVSCPIDALNSLNALPFKDLCNIVKQICIKLEPSVLIIDDINSYPSNGIKLALEEIDVKHKPIVICFQHGFFQFWYKYNQHFACDYFFCFGEKHKQEFNKTYQERVFVTGLPKIDRLATVKKSNEKYILFASQCDWSMSSATNKVIDIYAMLEKLLQVKKLPVKIKPHPQYYGVPQEALGKFEILDAQQDAIEVVARSSCVITTGSTIALEALVLDKPTVILPSTTGNGYKGCPMLANSIDINNVIKLLDDYPNKKAAISKYLDSVICNWRNFDGAQKAYDLIKKLCMN